MKYYNSVNNKNQKDIDFDLQVNAKAQQAKEQNRQERERRKEAEKATKAKEQEERKQRLRNAKLDEMMTVD